MRKKFRVLHLHKHCLGHQFQGRIPSQKQSAQRGEPVFPQRHCFTPSTACTYAHVSQYDRVRPKVDIACRDAYDTYETNALHGSVTVVLATLSDNEYL